MDVRAVMCKKTERKKKEETREGRDRKQAVYTRCELLLRWMWDAST
jgi:hypothetical protein